MARTVLISDSENDELELDDDTNTPFRTFTVYQRRYILDRVVISWKTAESDQTIRVQAIESVNIHWYDDLVIYLATMTKEGFKCISFHVNIR